MAKYRKKPITVEAEQFLIGSTIEGVVPVCYSITNDEEIICEYTQNVIDHGIRTPYNVGFGIKTLEGWFKVLVGDWIITGVKGEKYPCKPDIFEISYEEVT